jgi:VanZ family protein
MPAPDPAFCARVGDRHDDLRVVVRGLAKPPVLSRSTIRRLCLASLAVIVFGTLGPLGVRGPWVVPVEHWQLVPPSVPSDLNDRLTNFVVYVPVGIALRLLVRRRGQAGWADLLLGFGLSVALSYVTEVLQQAMPGRVSSVTDVYVNALAAFVGCLCAAAVQSALRRVHAYVFVQLRVPQRRWVILATTAVIATAVLMTMPWSPTRPRAEIGFDRPPSFVDVQRGGMFALVGFLMAGAALVRRGSRTAALAAAWLLGVLVATALELAQMVLHEHVCSLLHAGISVVGVSAGCATAALLVRPRAAPGVVGSRLRKLALLTLVAASTYVTAERGSMSFGAPCRAEPAIDWVPFHAQFQAPFPAVLADVLQQLAAYSLLTLLCVFLARDRGPAVALLLLGGLVGASECLQALRTGHHADTTAPLLAVSAWLLTTRIWRSCRPVAHPSSSFADSAAQWPATR